MKTQDEMWAELSRSIRELEFGGTLPPPDEMLTLVQLGMSIQREHIPDVMTGLVKDIEKMFHDKPVSHIIFALFVLLRIAYINIAVTDNEEQATVDTAKRILDAAAKQDPNQRKE